MKCLFTFVAAIGLAASLHGGAIHDAAREGNLELVRALVGGTPSAINLRDRGTTPLHEAARAGQLAVVKFLVEKGANVNATDISSATPLKLALGYHRDDVAAFLKAHGAVDKIVAQQSTKPATPAPAATAQTPPPRSMPEGSMVPRTATNPPVAARVPTNSIQGVTNAANDRDMLRVIYPIHEAARIGDAEQIKFLLKSFPDLLEATDEKGLTPLHVAAANKKKAAAEVLVGFRAKVNARSDTAQTPLHFAARSGDVGFVQLLLTNHADVNARDSLDVTPLLAATQPGEREEFQAVDRTDALRFTPAQRRAALSEMHNQQVVLAKVLLAAGADVNARNRAGANALLQAVRLRNEPLVDFLLRAGADPNAVDLTERVAPLHLSAGRGLTNIVTLLLKAKANINAPDARGETPLGYALRQGHRSVASLLKQHGATTGSSRALNTTEQSLVDFYQRTEAALAHASVADRTRLLVDMTATRSDAQKIFPRHGELAARVVEELRRQIKQQQPIADSEQGKEIWRVRPEPPSLVAQDWIKRGWIAREVPVLSLVVDRVGSTSRPGDYCFVNQRWLLLPPLDIIAAQQSAAKK